MIGRHTRLIPGRDKFEFAVLHMLMKFLKLAVDPHQKDVVLVPVLIFICNFQPGAPLRVIPYKTIYFNLYQMFYLPYY